MQGQGRQLISSHRKARATHYPFKTSSMTIIVVNYRTTGRSYPEPKPERIRPDESDKRAERERSYIGRRRRGLGIVWSIVLWAAFLATVCGAAFSQQAALVNWMHEAWKMFLATFP
jgi:hypothetical protein